MKWIPADETPDQDGRYITDIGEVEFRDGLWRNGKFRDTENSKVHKWLDESAPISPSPSSSSSKGEDCPKWYTRQEIYDWLIHKNYSKEIAFELADYWWKDLQGAFKKGWEKATNDNHPDKKDYKYFAGEAVGGEGKSAEDYQRENQLAKELEIIIDDTGAVDVAEMAIRYAMIFGNSKPETFTNEQVGRMHGYMDGLEKAMHLYKTQPSGKAEQTGAKLLEKANEFWKIEHWDINKLDDSGLTEFLSKDDFLSFIQSINHTA